MADTATTPTARSAQKGMVIRDLALEKPSSKKVLASMGKKKQKEASIAPS